MRYRIKIIDTDGNDISNQYRIASKQSEYGDIVTIRLLDNPSFKDTMLDDEIELLMKLVEEKIEYGNYIPTTRRLLGVYDKLVNIIKRK